MSVVHSHRRHRRAPVDLEVIVPVYNEESRIQPTLSALVDHLFTLPLSCSIVVVDNGSSDRSTHLADAIDRRGVPVEVIGSSTQGKGAAVRRGVLSSSARWVGFCDADLATPVTAFDDALRLLEAGHDVVVASRRCEGAELSQAQPLLRRAGGWGFRRWTGSLVAGIADTQCGFKFFRGEVVEDLFGPGLVTGFAFDLEVLARAHRRGLSIAEFPVVWTDQSGSTFSPVRHGLRAARDVRLVRRALQTSPA